MKCQNKLWTLKKDKFFSEQILNKLVKNNSKMAKISYRHLEFFKTTWPISIQLWHKLHWVMFIIVCLNEGNALFQEEIIAKYQISVIEILKSSSSEWLSQFQPQTSHRTSLGKGIKGIQ